MKRTLFITLFLSIFSFNSTVSADVKVVTSIKPIHSLAAYVMDGVGKPNVIVDGYNSPHGFSLKPSHAKMIENADLIIWVGEDLEAFLEKPLNSIAKKATKVELMDLKGIKKFVVVDDLLATGGTAKCVGDLLNSEGKDVLAMIVIINLKFLKGEENLSFPVYSQLNY